MTIRHKKELKEELTMSQRNKGIILMILSSLCFALMATAVKAAGDFPTMEKVFFRNIVGMVVSAILIYRSGHSFKGNNKPFLIYRSILGLSGVFLYFYAIDRLPLANAVILNQLNPFFVLILATLFLKERIEKIQGLAISIAVVGIFLIVKPQPGFMPLPALAGLLSAVFAAGGYTTVRHLRLTDHPQIIIFYFTTLSTLSALPFFNQFVMPTWPQLAALLSIGVFATGAQFLMTYSYRYAEASDLSIYSYGNTLFSIIIGLVLWLEIPDPLTLLGFILILTGAYLNYRYKRPTHQIQKEK
ncbi:DMT family transporter [Alkaliphilus crotonatoxidans]